MNELALFAGDSLCAMTCGIAISVHRRKMGEWTKNIGTERRATALFAARNSARAIRVASSNAARIRVAVPFKPEKRSAPALSAERNLCRPAQAMSRVLVRAEPLFDCLGGSSIRWSKCAIGLPFFAVRSLLGACGIRRTELHRFWGIRLRNCAPTLKPISRPGCHGATTAREAKNGA